MRNCFVASSFGVRPARSTAVFAWTSSRFLNSSLTGGLPSAVFPSVTMHHATLPLQAHANAIVYAVDVVEPTVPARPIAATYAPFDEARHLQAIGVKTVAPTVLALPFGPSRGAATRRRGQAASSPSPPLRVPRSA